MADQKITDLTALGAAPAGTDVVPIVDDPGGTPVTKKVTVSNLLGSLDASNIDAGTLTHERGGLEADVSAYTGLVAISGGATSEVDTKAELEAQIADVSDFAMADGDTYSGVHDFGGATSLEIPNGAAPTVDAAGEIAVDTTITDHTGLIKYHDGVEELTVIAVPTGNLTTTNNDVLAYDATNNEFYFKVDAGAGGGISNVVEDLTPQLGGQLDVNGQAIGDGTRELVTFTEDASAVNHVNIENEATGSGPIISAAGDDANIDLNINGKATGNVVLRDGTDVTKKMSFELSGATTAKTATITSSHTDDRTITLPDATDTLVGKATTDTLTNKTISLTSNTVSGTTAEFNSALSDGSFSTLAGTETLTNKTLTSPVLNTGVSGTAIADASAVNTGTSATTIVTPDALAGSNLGIRYVQAVVFDFTTDTATGDGKFYTHIPAALNGMNLVEVHAEVITAGTTGTTDIQIHNVTDAVDMLSTLLTIDSAETGSDTAATAAVINAANDDVATNDLLRIDVDAVSTTAAKGLIVTLGFQLP